MAGLLDKLMGTSSPFDADVEKATDEKNTSEDWALIMKICDNVLQTPNGAKDCLKSITKRMNHGNPNVVMQALTLLGACVSNCNKTFHLEVASREFEVEIRKLIGGKNLQKISDTMKYLLKSWAENEFKSDPQLTLIPSCYTKLKSEGIDFNTREPTKKTVVLSKDPNVVQSQQEEEDIAKAIQLSLKETKGSSAKSQSRLYPSARPSTPTHESSSSGPNSPITGNPAKDGRKVRALYDFEAAEDNELTFKAGEIIHIIDDSDRNWWKGHNQRGEGLFPANFVTADLSYEPEKEVVVQEKKVQFKDTVTVKTVPKQVTEINPSKIERALSLLHDADPTGDIQDSEALLTLEDQSIAMGPLIDQELDKVDRKHSSLSQLGRELMEALNTYHSLISQYPPAPVYQQQTMMPGYSMNMAAKMAYSSYYPPGTASNAPGQDPSSMNMPSAQYGMPAQGAYGMQQPPQHMGGPGASQYNMSNQQQPGMDGMVQKGLGYNHGQETVMAHPSGSQPFSMTSQSSAMSVGDHKFQQVNSFEYPGQNNYCSTPGSVQSSHHSLISQPAQVPTGMPYYTVPQNPMQQVPDMSNGSHMVAAGQPHYAEQ